LIFADKSLYSICFRITMLLHSRTDELTLLLFLKQSVLHCKSFFIMKEVRKDIKWFEWLYKASSLWRIKSLRFINWTTNRKQEKILSLNNIDKWWYVGVRLYKNKKQRSTRLHRVIADSFLCKIDGKRHVNHKDWNKLNNAIHNLERCTSSENHIHARKVLWRKSYLLWKRWKDNIRSKSIRQIMPSWETKVWNSMKEVHDNYGIRSWWWLSKCIKNGKVYKWCFREYEK